MLRDVERTIDEKIEASHAKFTAANSVGDDLQAPEEEVIE
jgi:hypothetical protein